MIDRTVIAGRVPKAKQSAAVRSLLGLPMRAKIGPLHISRRKAKAGQRVTVFAGKLTGRRAVATIVGQGVAYEIQLVVKRGIASVNFKLPKKLQKGDYYVGIVDPSRVRSAKKGAALVAASTLKIK